jgi:hypothetical protein
VRVDITYTLCTYTCTSENYFLQVTNYSSLENKFIIHKFQVVFLIYYSLFINRIYIYKTFFIKFWTYDKPKQIH